MPGVMGMPVNSGHMMGMQSGVMGVPRQPNMYGMQAGMMGMPAYQANMMAVQPGMMQHGLMGSQQKTSMSFDEL